MTNNQFGQWQRRIAGALLTIAAAVAGSQAQAAATIVIVNNNAAGVGFNDPTPVAPVGGNTGTTLGAQRLIAFQNAANIWGATLTSSQIISIRASFEALTCTATSAVLGSAGAIEVFRDFAGALRTNTWYSAALADKISGVNLNPSGPEISARFNVNLGAPGCLTGSPFYLGLDNNHGAQIDLVAVLLHEFGHGLGFQTFTSGSTGAQLAGFPSIWDHFLYGTQAGKSWVDMSAAERMASAISGDKLVWTGANVQTALMGVLQLGVAGLTISGPQAGLTAGSYLIGTASFGPPITAATMVAGQLMPVVDQANGTGLACDPLNTVNARAVSGRVALIDRGICGFVVKVKNAQNAGAIAVVIADNVAGSPPPGLGGSDPTITIPSVRITLADANALKARLAFRSRTASGVVATFGVNGSQYAGANDVGQALMFAPSPFQGGSSVSHWDTSAFPNQLMEPSINADLLHEVTPPADLTFTLFQDIGW